MAQKEGSGKRIKYSDLLEGPWALFIFWLNASAQECHISENISMFTLVQTYFLKICIHVWKLESQKHRII